MLNSMCGTVNYYNIPNSCISFSFIVNFISFIHNVPDFLINLKMKPNKIKNSKNNIFSNSLKILCTKIMKPTKVFKMNKDDNV